MKLLVDNKVLLLRTSAKLTSELEECEEAEERDELLDDYHAQQGHVELVW